MDGIGGRISAFIAEAQISRAKFSEVVGISQAYVSQICAGVRTPSDRVIAEMCRTFNINEHWLRTGEGEMLEQLDEDQELVEFMTGLLGESSDSFKRRFVAVLSGLDPADWLVLEKIADRLTGKTTDP